MTAATGTAQLSTGTWAIDPVHSTIGFSVRHLMVSKVRGTFDTFSGAVVVAEDGTPSVTAEIAVDSINTRNEQRDAHIKSADYFDAEQYPTATFTSTGVRPKGDTYLRRRRLHPEGCHQAGHPRTRVQRRQSRAWDTVRSRASRRRLCSTARTSASTSTCRWKPAAPSSATRSPITLEIEALKQA